RWLYLLPAGARDAANALTALAQTPTDERLATLSLSFEHTPQITATLSNLSQRQSWTPAELEVVRTHYQRRGIHFKPPALQAMLDAWSHPAEFGEAYLAALQSYYQVFFAEEEQRIHPALQMGAQHAASLAGRLTLPDLLDELSHGVHIADLAEMEEVILVASYWSSPLIFMSRIDSGRLLVVYGCREEQDNLISYEEAPAALVDALKAIGDPTRLAILRYLAAEPLTPSELARRLRLRAPTVVHHLNLLRLASLVEITLLPGSERRYALRKGALNAAMTNLQSFLDITEPYSPS
ncbi:MAG: helix-turn-helix transcriptional regulator, partial [Anaerolineae bacterium]|nr:helix-turn-helix transcriptional regulator [Anaerolineae bacterium]